MPAFSKRFFYTLVSKIRNKNKEGSSQNKLTIDFTKKQKSPFDIKSESSYNSYLSNGSLLLGMRKSNCIAWVEIPDLEYGDNIIETKIRLDSLGGYASTGIIFRIQEEDSYYLALVSGKGYFRFDVIKDGAPKALIVWTEIPDFDGVNIDLKIITYGTYFIFIINDKWIAQTNDDSISEGRLGFALASYEIAAEKDDKEEENHIDVTNGNEYTCKALMDYFSVDTRYKTVEEKYTYWTDDSKINADQRLRLAESFAVMGKSSKALEQIKRAWKRRDDAIRSAEVSYTEVRTKKELLLAERMAYDLGQYEESEKYVNLILEQYANSEEGKTALTEKAKILNELNKFTELKEFLLNNSGNLNKDIDYYTMLGRCHFEMKEYIDSAHTWEKAFKKNNENGVYAINAANSFELANEKEKALPLFISAAKIFLRQDNSIELSALIPNLSALGEKNWEARSIIGKWAFSIEDYDRCVKELSTAEKLRNSSRPRQKADPALFYLWGVVSGIKRKNKEAVRLLEKAVKLAPDYGLFRFKLVEQKIKNEKKKKNYAKELKLALKHTGDDMRDEMALYAGNLLLQIKDEKNAEYFLNITKKEQDNDAGN
jgi:tetratricopeptide (TPR) repeat protein